MSVVFIFGSEAKVKHFLPLFVGSSFKREVKKRLFFSGCFRDILQKKEKFLLSPFFSWSEEEEEECARRGLMHFQEKNEKNISSSGRVARHAK